MKKRNCRGISCPVYVILLYVSSTRSRIFFTSHQVSGNVTLTKPLTYVAANTITSTTSKSPLTQVCFSSSPRSSFRVRLAISLISMRDMERECVAEMRGARGTMVEAGAVSTLLTRGDFKGRSMLRPTMLHRGILKMCLQADSPGRRQKRRSRRKRPVGKRRAESKFDEEHKGVCWQDRGEKCTLTFLTSCTARQIAVLDFEIFACSCCVRCKR